MTALCAWLPKFSCALPTKSMPYAPQLRDRLPLVDVAAELDLGRVNGGHPRQLVSRFAGHGVDESGEVVERRREACI